MKKIHVLFILLHTALIFISINTTIASDSVKLPNKVEEAAIVCYLISLLQHGVHTTIQIVASLVILLILHMRYSIRKRKTCFRSPMYWLITIMIYLPSILYFFAEHFLKLLSIILGGDGLLDAPCPANVY